MFQSTAWLATTAAIAMASPAFAQAPAAKPAPPADEGASVGEVVVHGCGSVDESEGLQDTFDRMRNDQCSSLPVVRGDQVVGMVTLENVGELMMIRSALGDGISRSSVANIFDLR